MARRSPDPLEIAPLAYENQEFLNSADGRMLRIMAEYQEPMARFRRERIQDTVVFFGSARFRALDVANKELELLENTGSATPAPADEQPAPGPGRGRDGQQQDRGRQRRPVAGAHVGGHDGADVVGRDRGERQRRRRVVARGRRRGDRSALSS